MRLRPIGLWMLIAASLVTAPGCIFCGPWGRWHRCGYLDPDAVDTSSAGQSRNEAAVRPAGLQ